MYKKNQKKQQEESNNNSWSDEEKESKEIAMAAMQARDAGLTDFNKTQDLISKVLSMKAEEQFYDYKKQISSVCVAPQKHLRINYNKNHDMSFTQAALIANDTFPNERRKMMFDRTVMDNEEKKFEIYKADTCFPCKCTVCSK